MELTRILAQMTVDDLPTALDWYRRLFGRGPDTRPMDGLAEWHLGDAFGVQVWLEPERAGRSAMVIDAADLDAAARELAAAGISDDQPQDATTVRILPLTDPCGNRVVLTGPLR